MSGPERNMAENTSGSGPEGPTPGNSSSEQQGQTSDSPKGFFGMTMRPIRGSDSGARQPPEGGSKFPHPPDQPQRHKDPKGIDIIETIHPNESLIPPNKGPNIQVDVDEYIDAEGNVRESGITGARSTVTGKEVPLRLEPHVPQSEILRPPGLADLTSQGLEATFSLEDKAQEVPGLTPEEIEEFLAHDYTMEQLQRAAAQLDPVTFRREADEHLQRLRGGRAEEPVTTGVVPGTPSTVPPASSGGSGGSGGGGSEGPQPPEGSPQPPDRNSLEFEASPERGREIAEEIVYWEALRVAGRYSEVNWQRLDQLNRDQIIHIDALRDVSLRFRPFEGGEQVQQTIQEVQLVNPDIFNGFRPFEEWLNEYRTGAITDVPRFIREVNVYFEEAKRVGLLKDLDAVLANSFNGQIIPGIARGLTSIELMSGNPRAGIMGIDQRIQEALNSLTTIYRDRLWTDPEIGRLTGVGELYSQFARERFVAAINNRDPEGLTQRPYFIDNEFHLGQDVEDIPQEKYWHLEHGYYVYVDAQTPEEYQIAAESYITRLESITTSPQELLQESKYFVQAILRSEGFDKVNNEFPGFINELVYQIEARIGAFGADTANEGYHLDEYVEYMKYINKDFKGPERLVALTRLLDGEVSAAMWGLDKDPRWEILFSLFGSRGQLAKDTAAQRGKGGIGLFYQARELFVEELMGVRIKDKRNIAKVTDWMSDRNFTSLFEGLFRYGKVPIGRSPGDANIRAYEQFKDVPDAQLTADQRYGKRLGRIQLELRGGKKVEDLSSSDKKLYKDARIRAEKAFDIAFQIYGALGEKSKRAGGAFKINRVENGEEFQEFIPVHYAEKLIQFAETWTEMKYAEAPAKTRATKAREARQRAIEELKKNGFEAILKDENGNPMLLKRPKEDLNTLDELARDASGNLIVEEVPVDFYIATHHPYGDWTSHTYWSYQEEDRHMVLDPVTFAKARAIREGKIRPEDADPWAIQLLILDPTLRRVRRFNKKRFEERERKLTAAAVEDSYQGHWRIGRELHEAFFPKYGTPAEEIGIYYGLRDYGVYRKIIENIRARLAEDPERHARRGRRLIPYVHIPMASLAEIWGQGSVGALGAIRMLGSPIYRMGSTLALDKVNSQIEIAGKMHEALTVAGKDQEGNLIEPLLLKLTNDSDSTLQEFFQKLPKGWWADPAKQQEFCVAVRKSFGRLERYEKLMVTMETLIRKASGALWLEEEDVLTDSGELDRAAERRFRALPDINKEDLTRDDLAGFIAGAEDLERMSEDDFNRKFNTGNDQTPGIDEGLMSFNTGSGRHSARIFHDAFMEVFLDEGKRGGFQLYPTERFIYKHLRDKIVYYNPTVDGKVASREEDIIDWLFSKFVPT